MCTISLLPRVSPPGRHAAATGAARPGPLLDAERYWRCCVASAAFNPVASARVGPTPQ